MSKLVVVRGNSASGKSTVARLVQSQSSMPIAVIEQDYFRHDLFGSNWGDDQYHARASVMADMTVGLLQRDITVIIEGSLPSMWFAGVLANIRRRWHGRVAAYCFVLPLDETIRRHTTRDKQSHFGEDTLREWYREHDPVDGLDEHIWGVDVAPDDAAQQILHQLAQ